MSVLYLGERDFTKNNITQLHSMTLIYFTLLIMCSIFRSAIL